MESKELAENLKEYYQPLLTKYYKFQMGNDEYEPTTAELSIIRPLMFILSDLNSRI